MVSMMVRRKMIECFDPDQFPLRLDARPCRHRRSKGNYAMQAPPSAEKSGRTVVIKKRHWLALVLIGTILLFAARAALGT
jgi:hypothetical protein